jgi:hypothetical protein
MSNELKVIPTPIQRNYNDVAMELTQLHFSSRNSDVEEIQEVYKKFYATARVTAEMSSDELETVLGEQI